MKAILGFLFVAVLAGAAWFYFPGFPKSVGPNRTWTTIDSNGSTFHAIINGTKISYKNAGPNSTMIDGVLYVYDSTGQRVDSEAYTYHNN